MSDSEASETALNLATALPSGGAFNIDGETVAIAQSPVFLKPDVNNNGTYIPGTSIYILK